ncbi:swi5-dependent recombination DNA repair protein 1 homolog [Sinocyclocheilus anshuiensis]|uniref:swi5-dependent recombination DNA repair protein 1 homolog n=1 Tax=Sinocyclocheilus anshuiensis TaxID=1608454 RepID=UPI0007B7F0AA|nr:PREDICTED: swi5-dependent recombination DNA repair protein 1 homolog [Sinocyclocheilus anshuiensis]
MEITPIKLTPANENTPNTSQTSSSSRSSANKPMSSSLKEKLKRSRHSFRSPLSMVKRLKIEDDSQPQTSQPGDRETDTDVHRNMREQRDCSHHTAEPAQKHLIQQCEELRKAVKEKSETLRRLKMAKMYRTKNDLTQLQRLIDKWRSCAQSVLCELQSEIPSEGKQVSLSQLIGSLGLDDKILHFDRTEEDFTDN